MTISASVPDAVSQEAEQLARRNPDTFTDRLNAVWDSVAEPEDRFVTETVQDVLHDVEW